MSGNLPTKYTDTGQHSNPGRFVQPGSVAAWDRYAYVENNPLRYTDPSGHMVDEGGGGCEDTGRCKLSFLERRSNEILVRLGGKDDLEAMAQIVEVGVALYDTYAELLPEINNVFMGFRNVSFLTLLQGCKGGYGGCAELGRGQKDCPSNVDYFQDTGFHADFRDGGNQVYHVWPYITNVGGRFSLGGMGLSFAQFGN